MSPVSFSLAFVLGVFLQSLLVGLFIPLLVVASYVQWRKISKGQSVNVVMAFATIFFGLTIPIHLILGMRKVILGALFLPQGMTIDRYLQPPYGADELVRRALFQLQVIIGDFIMIYRMYHIYDKSILACVIPLISTSGLIAVSCGLTNQIRSLETPAEWNAYSKWSTACFCVTLFNSAFTSSAISLRLWRVHRETVVAGANFRPESESIVLRAMRVLVEGAALWTLIVSMGFLAFLAKSNLRYTFLYMTSPVVGISFCLIIVRLGVITAEVRDDSWESSQRSRSSRMTGSGLSRLPVPLDRVKVERDVYIDESKGDIELQMGPMPLGMKQKPVI